MKHRQKIAEKIAEKIARIRVSPKKGLSLHQMLGYIGTQPETPRRGWETSVQMKSFVLAALACAAIASPAFAGSVSATVGATTNYIARGTSQTYGQPAYQGSIDFTPKDNHGFYAGTFLSTMDFQEGTHEELDFYGGYRTTVQGWNVDASVIAITYHGDDDRPNWNMFDADLLVNRSFGKWTAGAKIGLTPDYFNAYGASAWTEGQLSYAVSDKLSVGGSVGRQFIKDGWSYSTWNVGATYAVTPTLSVDARWSDTNRHDLDQSYDGAFSLTVRKTINFK